MIRDTWKKSLYVERDVFLGRKKYDESVVGFLYHIGIRETKRASFFNSPEV